MNVGDGGGSETAEWVNALFAAFWSLLQPIVTRYRVNGKFFNNHLFPYIFIFLCEGDPKSRVNIVILATLS